MLIFTVPDPGIGLLTPVFTFPLVLRLPVVPMLTVPGDEILLSTVPVLKGRVPFGLGELMVPLFMVPLLLFIVPCRLFPVPN